MAGIISNGVLIKKFVAPISIISNQPVFVADSISLRRTTNSQNAQRWEIQTRVEPSTNDAEMLLHTVVNGKNNIITVQMPQILRASPNNTTSTSTVLSQGAVVGSSSVIVSNNNGRIAKGEFIRFQNHSKVYMVTQTLNLNGVLNIFPPLRQTITNNTVISYGNSVNLQGYYGTETTLGIVFEDGIISDPGTISIIEAT
jgi:hypothetical protein